jgi:hypothetical protein
VKCITLADVIEIVNIIEILIPANLVSVRFFSIFSGYKMHEDDGSGRQLITGLSPLEYRNRFQSYRA